MEPKGGHPVRPLCVFACATLLASLTAHAAEPLKLSGVKWDFEDGTLQGWTVTGDLGKQPSSTDNDRWQGNFNKHGKYFIGTYENGDKVAGDQVTGELRSPLFVIDADLLGLLVGGGDQANATYVALCDAEGDKELMKACGQNAEAMADIVWDVSKLKGKTVYLKVVDRAPGGWGHINVDFVRMIDKAEWDRLEREKLEAAERARKAQEEMLKSWAETNAKYRKTVFEPVPRRIYKGAELRNAWMPVGGIGAGGLSVTGSGEFTRWMIHDGRPIQIPDAFFAVRAKAGDAKPVARLLRTGANGVKDIEFYGEFPIAYHKFLDDALPVRVSQETFSPFIPLNEKDSALPVVFFFITVENPGKEAVEVTLLASLQNAVGRSLGDKDSGPSSVDNKGYGGNIVAPLKVGRFAGAEMTKAGQPGSMALLAADAEAKPLEPWTEFNAFWTGPAKPLEKPGEPTAAGKTSNAGVGVTFTLKAGEKRTVPFLWAWHLPGAPRATHMYENWFASAGDVAKYADANLDRLTADTRLFRDTLFATTLPYYVVERLSSQCSTLTTRVVNWTKAGNVYGWEGLGCCHGGCTHVWNYEQTMAHLFPALERRMRDLNLTVGQAPDGGVFNRMGAPDAPWGDGTEGPAADGHASTLSKTYREWRLSPDDQWLKKHYPAVKKAMEFWIRTWDGKDEDGVARDSQFNTYDTACVGPNTFIGSQYLAALRAAEEMAKVCGDEDSAKRWHAIFEKGSAAYATECWDDELKYFVQRIPQGKRAHDYGNACFIDQVLGQWWAWVNDLGYVLPKEKVDAALAAIAKWNMAGDMSLYKYHYDRPRIFIWGKGKGLLMCLWPRGDYITQPILYREEVWTGCEYHAAASMVWQGMLPEGMAAVKAVFERYNDGARSPWNEIECGDHYARAMSSWSVLLACQGFSCVGPRGKLGFAPRLTPDDHRSFFAGAEGWGTFTQKRAGKEQQNTIEVKWGKLRLLELSLGLPPGAEKATASLQMGNARAEAKSRVADGKLILTLDAPLTLAPGSVLTVVTQW